MCFGKLQTRERTQRWYDIIHKMQLLKKTAILYKWWKVNISQAALIQFQTLFFYLKMKLHYLKGIFEVFLTKVYLEINRVLETLKIDDQKYNFIQQGPY